MLTNEGGVAFETAVLQIMDSTGTYVGDSLLGLESYKIHSCDWLDRSIVLVVWFV